MKTGLGAKQKELEAHGRTDGGRTGGRADGGRTADGWRKSGLDLQNLSKTTCRLRAHPFETPHPGLDLGLPGPSGPLCHAYLDRMS